jgi:G2/mitotic-specific cyclin 3/4
VLDENAVGRREVKGTADGDIAERRPRRQALQTVTNTNAIVRRQAGKVVNASLKSTVEPTRHKEQTFGSADKVKSQFSVHEHPVEECPGSDDTVEDDRVDEEEEEEDDDEEVSDHMKEEVNDSATAESTRAKASTNTNSVVGLFPQTTEADRLEIKIAAQEVEKTIGFFDDEDEDLYDISMVMEYGEDIFDYMRQLEMDMRPDPNYMARQEQVRPSMRAILIDWLVQVHERFHLLPETLFLTVNYIDRFMSTKSVALDRFQLVGAVALFLAAKYEEINCPSVQEIAYMVDHGYTVDEILSAERYMVDILEFKLGWPGPMSFLRRTSKADDYDLETRTLAKYFLEVTIMDDVFIGAPPSWLAAAAHYLARTMLNRGPWTKAHVFFSGYTETQLVPACQQLALHCKNAPTHHKAIFEKYSERRFKKAALYSLDYFTKNSDA